MNCYASLSQIKEHLGLTSTQTADDARLLRVLEAVSRLVDQHCSRWFYTETRTRYYTARHGDRLRVHDAVSITALTSDTDDDGTHETTWAATDYRLQPRNAPYESPPEPYTHVVTTQDGDHTFPTSDDGVEISGRWGYSQELETSSATLAEGLDNSETGVDVSSGAALSAGQTILIGSEQAYIRSISTNTLTVTRGVNGTTAATHSNGATIQVYRYPRPITEAVLYQTALNHLAGAAATGQAGVNDFEQPIRAGGLHPFARQMLDPYRRVEIR